MKIPQRQDQVSLNSPQVATGKAVEPVAEAMGSSYVDTMKGLSKSMKELSDLSFKLYENAIEGQQERLKLYTTQRTKQYEKEIGLATTQGQIDELTNVYKEDIEKVGGSLLGDDRYKNWYSKEGGAIVAGSEYAGAVAKAQLQINANKQNIEDIGDKYNVAAFTAETIEDRNKAIKSYEEMLDANVKNGTISTAEKANMQREWNHKLAVSLIERELDRNTEETIKQLQTNPDYFPGITSEERNRFIEQGLRLQNARKGTTKSEKVNKTAEWWQELYWDNNPDLDVKRKNRNEASRIFDVFTNDQKAAKKIMAEVLGVEEKEITFEDVDSARKLMSAVSNREDQERSLNYLNILSGIDVDRQGLFFYEKEMENGEKKTIFPKGYELIKSFEEGKFKNTFSDLSQGVDLFNSYGALFSNPQTKTFATNDYQKVYGEMYNMSTLLVKGIRSDKNILGAKEDWSANMKEAFSSLFDAIDSAYSDGLEERRMALFTTSFLQQAQAFSNGGVRDAFGSEVSEDVATKAITATYNALVHAGVQEPEKYIGFFYKNYTDLNKKSISKKITEGAFATVGAVFNPDLKQLSQDLGKVGPRVGSGGIYTGGNK